MTFWTKILPKHAKSNEIMHNILYNITNIHIANDNNGILSPAHA